MIIILATGAPVRANESMYRKFIFVMEFKILFEVWQTHFHDFLTLAVRGSLPFHKLPLNSFKTFNISQNMLIVNFFVKIAAWSKLCTIPHICHFFTLTHFQAWKFFTQKRVNLRQKLPRDKTA